MAKENGEMMIQVKMSKFGGVSDCRVPFCISKEAELCHKSLEPDLHTVEILQAYLEGMLIRSSFCSSERNKKAATILSKVYGYYVTPNYNPQKLRVNHSQP